MQNCSSANVPMLHLLQQLCLLPKQKIEERKPALLIIFY